MDEKTEAADDATCSNEASIMGIENYMNKVDLVKCPGCKYESSTENVRIHLKKEHVDKKFCKICDKSFQDKTGVHCLKHLLITIISHLKEQCSECSTLFMLEVKRSEDEVFMCDKCKSKVASGAQEAGTPIEKDTPKYAHMCDVCHKRFAHRKTLNEHLRTVHGGNEMYRCDFCPRVFYYRKNLNAHRKVHTNPVVCEICFSEFHNFHSLNRHMASHADAPEYNCSSCGKTFPSLAIMQSHAPCRGDGGEDGGIWAPDLEV